MVSKAITIKRLDKFLQVADAINGPKFVDTLADPKLAFFNARYKRIEYVVQDDEDLKRLLKSDFIECAEREIYETW
jgi:hypothetical protein